MGARVGLPAGRIAWVPGAGVRVESDELQEPSLVRRLALNPASPLYPFVVERVSWPREGPFEATLTPGYYVIESMRHPVGALGETRSGAFRYLEVTPGAAAWVSEAKALEALGAVAALTALGLDDAAVTLMMGDLDGARVQWLRHRAGGA
jgi:hypothetical protein